MKAHGAIFGVCFTLILAACGSTAAGNASDPAAPDSGVPADAAENDAAAGGEGVADGLTTDTVAADGVAADGSDGALTDGTGADASGKLTSCAAIVDCAAAACAGSTAPTCASACLASGATDVLPAATGLLTCVQKKCMEGECKGKTDPKCMTDCSSLRCMPQVFACIEDGKTGSGTCADVKPCFDTCNAAKSGTFACLEGCYGKVSADGKAKAKPFAECTAKAPPGGDPASGCMPEIFGCFLDGKSGDKGCYDSFACLGACEKLPGDPFDCALGCLGKMSKPAQAAYLDVAPCLGKDVTMTAACEDKLVVCLAPTGTQTCDEALGCVFGCSNGGGGGGGGGDNNDPSCIFSCLHNTTAAADKLLMSKLGCQPKDPGCAEGLVSCIAPTGGANCGSVISCAMACGGGKDQPPDLKCTFACIKTGTQQSATMAFNVMNCMGKKDPACTDQMVACYNPTGSDDCIKVGACAQACAFAGKNVGTCQQACYEKASVKGFKDFQDWMVCNDVCSKNCVGDQTCKNKCLSAQCPATLAVCAVP